MGTNYYAIVDQCSCCGRSERLHIGKSSSGWKFGLHVASSFEQNSPIPKTLREWLLLLDMPNTTIETEYKERVSFADFCMVLLARTGDLTSMVDYDKSAYSPYHTIDCILGDFS